MIEVEVEFVKEEKVVLALFESNYLDLSFLFFVLSIGDTEYILWVKHGWCA